MFPGRPPAAAGAGARGPEELAADVWVAAAGPWELGWLAGVVRGTETNGGTDIGASEPAEELPEKGTRMSWVAAIIAIGADCCPPLFGVGVGIRKFCCEAGPMFM